MAEKIYIKYAIVSLVVTLVDYSTFIFVYYFTNVFTAQLLAYTIAILLSFKLHGNFVFGFYRKTHVALSAVILFSLVGLLASYLILFLFIFLIENVFIAKILLTATMFIYNYYTKRYAYGSKRKA